MKVRFCSVRNRYLLTSARFSMSFDISCHRHENVFHQFLISLGLPSRMVSNQKNRFADFYVDFSKRSSCQILSIFDWFLTLHMSIILLPKNSYQQFRCVISRLAIEEKITFDSISIFQIIKLYQKLWVALNLLVSCFTDYLTASKPRLSHHIRVIDILVKPRRTVFCSLLHKRTSKLKFCLPCSKLS